jgi:hypothetical protein
VKRKLIRSRKRLAALAITGAVVVAGAGAAFAFFTSTGSGAGSAKTGTASNVTISQVGAGYDSLIPTAVYHQDQTFGGASITELGDSVKLANPGAQQLVNVVVAMDNWGTAITALPMTLTIDNGVAGPVSDTEDFSFPAATTIGSDPSETNVTFNFSGQGAFVEQSFVYGISFSNTVASSLNVALSSSANNLSVGSETNPGTVWVDATDGSLGNDFPACSTPVPTGVFESVITNCGPFSATNPGAYGTTAEVQAGSADIPAVEINVVGGIVPVLTPGGPSQPVDFAITNSGSASAHVTTVTAGIGTVPAGPNNALPACSSADYSLNDPDGTPGGVTINEDIAPGTTLFVPSGVNISMVENHANQDNCEGAVIPLTFTSN